MHTTAAVHPVSGPLLITGSPNSRVSSNAARIALDLIRRRRQQAQPLRLTIIDRSDRSLIRLRQLPETMGYTTSDYLPAVPVLIAQVLRGVPTAAPPSAAEPGLDLLILHGLDQLWRDSQDWERYRERQGRQGLLPDDQAPTAELDELIGRHDATQLMVVATAQNPLTLPAPIRARFSTTLRCAITGDDELIREGRCQPIELADRDQWTLTAAIASLQQGWDHTPPEARSA